MNAELKCDVIVCTADCGCTRSYVPELRRYPGASFGSGLVWSRAAGLDVGRRTKPFRRACARDHVFIEVFLEELFQFRAVDQRDAIAVGELLAGTAEPRCGDQYAGCGVMVGHYAGQGMHGLKPDQAGPSLGLYQAYAPEEQVLAGRDRSSPAQAAHRARERPGQGPQEPVLEA
jgi:hypothetical protein